MPKTLRNFHENTLFERMDGDRPGIPLEFKVPNAETRAAMEESRAMMAARRARFASADELIADLKENNSQ